MTSVRRATPPVLSSDGGTVLSQELSKNGPVATPFIRAVTPHGEVRAMRKRCKYIQEMGRLGAFHFRSVAHFKAAPSGAIRMTASCAQQRCAGREVRQPDVKPVALCILGFRHTSGRATDGPDAQAFSPTSRASELDDSDGHQHLRFAILQTASTPLGPSDLNHADLARIAVPPDLAVNRASQQCFFNKC